MTCHICVEYRCYPGNDIIPGTDRCLRWAAWESVMCLDKYVNKYIYKYIDKYIYKYRDKYINKNI